MKQGFFDQHWTDEEGRPAGGVIFGRGFCISFQNGPLGRGETRRSPNGAFVEDIIGAAISRLEFYQTGRETTVVPSPVGVGKFNCKENAEALHHLYEALEWLTKRTSSREARGVEGTHAV
jgi:hypothetical protein